MGAARPSTLSSRHPIHLIEILALLSTPTRSKAPKLQAAQQPNQAHPQAGPAAKKPLLFFIHSPPHSLGPTNIRKTAFVSPRREMHPYRLSDAKALRSRSAFKPSGSIHAIDGSDPPREDLQVALPETPRNLKHSSPGRSAISGWQVVCFDRW